jgi:hypothetical protein
MQQTTRCTEIQCTNEPNASLAGRKVMTGPPGLDSLWFNHYRFMGKNVSPYPKRIFLFQDYKRGFLFVFAVIVPNYIRNRIHEKMRKNET